ncbi:MAG: hypothetical protein ACR2MG_00480 [Pyrinomonadaceae bacterium]
MKLNISNKIITAGLLFVLAILSFACQKQTPTEVYKLLYAAVKAKDKNKIRQLMSKSSIGLAEFSASQQKKQVDDILENGFTGTTFASSLPEMRDERIKDNFGALEVYNQTDNRWEDLPFVLEDGGWKLAFGDILQNTYKLPGKGQAELERESSGNNMMQIPTNSNSPNSNKMTQMPPANKPKK